MSSMNRTSTAWLLRGWLPIGYPPEGERASLKRTCPLTCMYLARSEGFEPPTF